MKIRQHRKTVQRRMHKALRLRELFLRSFKKILLNSCYGAYGHGTYKTDLTYMYKAIIDESTVIKVNITP